jgi:predicted nucleic acid-binding protein
MNLVIDTNIFMSALIKDGLTRRIIFETDFTLLFPEFEFDEIFNHKKEIIKKSKLTEPELNTLLLTLLRRVRIIRAKRIMGFRERARRIIGHIDKDDVTFVATALAFNCAIWSDDNHFQMQKEIRIYATREIIEKFVN